MPDRSKGARDMQGVPNIEPRLKMLGIDAGVRISAKRFFPIFEAHIDRIVADFYDHLYSFAEARRLLGDAARIARLQQHQKLHWLRLFSCSLDADYVRGALHVGEIHYARRIPPYLYLAGYNFFHCELIRLASATLPGLEVPQLLADLTRLVTLDMDLALSAYTREHWRAAVPVPISGQTAAAPSSLAG